MNDWAVNLRTARKRRGWTQSGLADRAGVGQPAVSLIENGYDGTAETRKAIAGAVDCPETILFPYRGAADTVFRTTGKAP